MLDGVDLGEPSPLCEQVRLGDFWLPNGDCSPSQMFETYDPSRHRQVVSRHEL